MNPILAWAILIFGWILPLLHVTFSAKSGSWTPPPGSRCPIGPRPGWVVMVLVLGPVGYLLYWRSRKQLGL